MPHPSVTLNIELFSICFRSLSDYYHLVPVGIETNGAYGPLGIKLVKQIGKKIQDTTVENLSTFQSISMTIQ